MKKLLVILLLSVSLGAVAKGRWYDYDRKNYMGVRLGVSASHVFFKGCENASLTARAGWDVLFVAGHQLGNGVPLFIEGGLGYVQKPVSVDYMEGSYETNRSFVEIPVVFKYKIGTGVDDFTVQPFLGGYFAVGVGGVTRLYPDKVKFETFSNSFLRRADAGLRLGCGIAYQNFYFDISYDIGLANVARSGCQYWNYDSFDNKMRNGSFCATVGLDF